MAKFKEVGQEDSQGQHEEWQEHWSMQEKASDKQVALFTTIDDKMKAIKKCSEEDWESLFNDPTNMKEVGFRVITGSELLSYCKSSVKTPGSPFFGNEPKTGYFVDAFLGGLWETGVLNELFKGRSDAISSELLLNLVELETCVFPTDNEMTILPPKGHLVGRPLTAALVDAIEACAKYGRRQRKDPKDIVKHLRSCVEPISTAEAIANLGLSRLYDWWFEEEWEEEEEDDF